MKTLSELRQNMMNWIRAGMKPDAEPVIEGEISNLELRTLVEFATVQPKTVIEDCLLMTHKFKEETRLESKEPNISKDQLVKFLKDLQGTLLRED